MAITKLLFVDTNIWLDFYRGRGEASFRLLNHLESVSEKVIVTYQLESEFKSNRQNAVLEGMKDLKTPEQISRPGLFSDAQAARALKKHLGEAKKRVNAMRRKLGRVLANPTQHDPVFQACQRIFHRDDSLVLNRDDRIRKAIRARALRRFLHGCPPRKRNDTSLGDAINWEWMVHCALQETAELVIVSRDTDYGVSFEGRSYINDHLRQEFSERVSKKRKLLLYVRLSEALKHFEIPVTAAEEEEEEAFIEAEAARSSASSDVTALFFQLIKDFEIEQDKVKDENGG